LRTLPCACFESTDVPESLSLPCGELTTRTRGIGASCAGQHCQGWLGAMTKHTK
jgi:hypothetical protein